MMCFDIIFVYKSFINPLIALFVLKYVHICTYEAFINDPIFCSEPYTILNDHGSFFHAEHIMLFGSFLASISGIAL